MFFYLRRQSSKARNILITWRSTIRTLRKSQYKWHARVRYPHYCRGRPSHGPSPTTDSGRTAQTRRARDVFGPSRTRCLTRLRFTRFTLYYRRLERAREKFPYRRDRTNAVRDRIITVIFTTEFWDHLFFLYIKGKTQFVILPHLPFPFVFLLSFF